MQALKYMFIKIITADDQYAIWYATNCYQVWVLKCMDIKYNITKLISMWSDMQQIECTNMYAHLSNDSILSNIWFDMQQIECTNMYAHFFDLICHKLLSKMYVDV